MILRVAIKTHRSKPHQSEMVGGVGVDGQCTPVVDTRIVSRDGHHLVGGAKPKYGRNIAGK